MARVTRLGPMLVPLGLFALAVAVRALPYRTVVTVRVYPFGNDPFYHLRRIFYSVVHFPATLGHDPYLNYPDGAQAIWTPVFDWLVAAIIFPFAGADSLERVEQIAIWVPPLLGAATVVAVYLLAKRYFDRATALLAGLILALLPAHTWWSQLGFVDHHAATPLLSTLLLASAMGLLARSAPAGAMPWSRARATGAALAAALLLWPGMLLDVLLVETGLVAFALSRAEQGEAQRFAAAFTLAQAFAFALVLPLGATASGPPGSAFSPLQLSGFQPWLFACLAAGGAACVLLWRGDRLGGSPGARLASASAIALLVLAASGPLLPELWQGAAESWRWLGRAESFQGQVSESLPLFMTETGFSTRMAVSHLSAFVFALPLALALLLLSLRRTPGRGPLLLFLWWALGLGCVTLLQRRFLGSSAIAAALLMAWSARTVWQELPLRVRSVPRAATRSAVLLLGLAILVPVYPPYAHDLSNWLRLFGDGSFTRTQYRARQRTMMEMAQWLRFNTPPTRGWLEPTQQPEYGVVGSWELGHVMKYSGRRPTVADNFGDDLGGRGFALAQRYFQSGEREASEILGGLRARYVVAQGNPSFLEEKPGVHSMLVSLYYFDGTTIGGGREDPGRRPLERHRLIYESRPWPRADSPPLYKVFEFVPGARVVGRAHPGARIEVLLHLRTNRDRDFVYKTTSMADDQGRYALRLPYATLDQPPAVLVSPHYAFQCEGEQAGLAVAERSVSRGQELRGPDLCLGSAPG